MLEVLADFAVAAAVMATGLGAGRKMTAPLFSNGYSRTERLAFSTAAGTAVLSLLLLAAGSFAGTSPPVILATLAIAAAACAKEVVESCKELAQAALQAAGLLRRKLTSAREGGVSRVCAAGIALALAIHFLSALAPPSSPPWGPNDLDSLGYHLAAPKQYLETGAIAFLQSSYQPNGPMMVQMLYLPAIAFASAVAAKLVAFALSLAALAAVFALGRRMTPTGGNPTDAGLASAAVFLTTQAVGFSFGLASVDVPAALYAGLALVAMAEWLDTRQAKWAAAAGAMAGGLVATKIAGTIFVPAMLACAAITAWAACKATPHRTTGSNKQLVQPPASRALRQFALFSLFAFAIVLPWLARTYAYAGNPVWPLYHPVFAAIGIPDNGAAQWTEQYRSGVVEAAGVAKTAGNFVLSPLLATFQGRKFDGSLTPLFLALLPLAAFLKRPRHAKLLAAFCAISLISWFFSFQLVRYLIPALPALAALSGSVLVGMEKGLDKEPKAARLLPAAIIFAALLASAVIALAYKHDALPVSLGLESRDAYLGRTQYNYAVAKWVNENLPKNATVLLVNDGLGYYYDRRVVYDALPMQMDHAGEMSQQQFSQYVAVKLAAQYAVLNTNTAFGQNHDQPDKIERLVKGLLAQSTLLYQANGLQVYALG